MTSKRSPLSVVAILVIAFAATPFDAAVAVGTPGFATYDAGGFGHGSAGIHSTYGVDFLTNVPIEILELGVFDGGANGLVRAREMAVFSASGTLLGGVTVPAGTSARLDGPFDPGGLLMGSGFRYEPLPTPISIAADTQFTIAILYEAGPLDELPSFPAFTTDPALQYLRARKTFPPTATLDLPAITTNSRTLPMNFTLQAVPLPGALPLLASALVGFGVSMRRRVS